VHQVKQQQQQLVNLMALLQLQHPHQVNQCLHVLLLVALNLLLLLPVFA